ncbi:MAG TPA: hypothetical protein PKA64_09670 [Myxococcota bacterium]|nr:hypothetical protein [Myxococcota bacterium]
MARSLTVQHEENVRTTGLLNGFLLFAAAWMLLNAMTWAADADVGGDAELGAQGYAP